MISRTWTRAWCCVFLCITCFASYGVEPAYASSSQADNSIKSAKAARPKQPVKRTSPLKSAAPKKSVADQQGPGRISVSADAAVLMDVKTGDVLFEKQENKRRPPASTTKIMTAILGLELGNSDEIVTVSQKAANVGEATLHLDPGEKINLYELITGALVKSGNDACVAIAENIAGSEKQFVQLMNMKALALGAQNTHFGNTNGLPLKDHYSTAYDLALMARHGLSIPQFASITRQKETEIHFLEPDVMMDLRNTNKLLWNYPYADGVKTGTTTAAGKCLVASATKDGRQLLVVVLHAPDRFGDAQKLLEWGFNNTEIVHLANAGQTIAEFTKSKDPVRVFTEAPVDVSITKTERLKLQTHIVWEKNGESPLKAGERLGRWEIWLGKQKLGTVPLLSECDAAKNHSLLSFYSFGK
ncbi:D-alanyl-D-alanine carboxypeptidase DacB precursor [Desulfosporosinus acididurans]|uniref:serine-type D-Ala-D-Ala carboxypeptidase n=1 Tax=Desulfosporosinus acididurans TaxID=476652 RepID=A0A0J1FMQ7_9FIRM|nr:D-alanyl-D-alanine carboxypeptidase family protein [Desulfosporosinus acididurans]KLU64779.1 D-alanyl-D-alanine carboxypeptidase DacB precursor [Desulfosporosinus acididurans]